MIFDVTLRARLPVAGVPVEQVAELSGGAPFPVSVEMVGDVWVLRCAGVVSDGMTAFPEALRKAQLGVSVGFRESSVPGLAGRGLLWADIVSADVRVAG